MIIVTGGAGFIGSALVGHLNGKGITNILVVDNLGSTEKWQNLVGKEIIDYVHKDVFIERIRNEDFNYKVSGVIHLGACSSTTERDADYMISNNFHYSKDLARWAIARNYRFIYASSAATYGDGSQGFSDDTDSLKDLRPLNVYGYSKQLFDLWAQDSRNFDKIVGLKFFNVYGPNEDHKGDMKSVVNKGFEQIRETGELTLFKSHREDYADGEQKRDFIYVKDCVSLIAELLKSKAIHGLFNLGTGDARSFKDLGLAIFEAMGLEPNIRYVDMPQHLQDKYQYYTEAKMDKLADISHKLHLTSLEEGVSDYVKNYLLTGDRL